MTEETNVPASNSNMENNFLQSILKDPKKKRIAIGIIAVIGVIILLYAFGIIGPKVAATVNGEKIYLSEINARYDNLFKYIKSNKGAEPTEKNELVLKSKILDRLIQDEIIKQAAEKSGINLSDVEVKNRVKEIKKAFPKNLEQALNQLGYSKESIDKYAKAELYQAKLRKKKIEEVEISDKEAKKYYEEFKADDPIINVHTQIKVSVAKVKSKSDAYAVISEGKADFNSAGNKYAKDDFLSSQYQTKDQLTEKYGSELANKVFLSKEGSMTEVIKVLNGYAIAKVESTQKSGYVKDFKDVKNDLKEMLRYSEEKSQFEKFFNSFKTTVKVVIELEEYKNPI